ncbi:hypothetical protein VTN00DRAFT_9208 [Thermoascus crustaceus]|uniref:uncharacterized protein n=1 Tax=Thermoascus crustaceus TaxID=5088 RepID=UPI0037442F5E
MELQSESAFLVLSPSCNLPESPINRQSEANRSSESLPEHYHKTQRSNSSSSESSAGVAPARLPGGFLRLGFEDPPKTASK